jgi:multimeric flavodoxin WrbA
MRIISLLATPHGLKGNTAGLLEHVMEGARGAGAAVETIVLPGGTIGPCKACDVCHKTGVCPQKDDFEPIKAKIFEAEGLVLATPNYIFHVSAQLKAFIDRCCGVIHTMAFDGKYGASIVTSGGGDEEPIAEYMNRFLITTGISPVGAVWATMGGIADGQFPDDIKEEAAALGARLVESCRSKAAIPSAEDAKEEFRQRMQMLVQFRKDEWPYEHEYWQKHHGME